MTTIESSPDAASIAATDAASIAAGDRDVDAAAASAWIVELFTSTDHKVTGRLYLTGGLLGLLAALVVNVLLGIERLDGADTTLDAEILPQLLDAQRIGLVFAAILPLAMAACVAFVPLQVGARAIAFPRLASMGFWMWFAGAVLTAIALVNNGGTLGSDGDMVDLFIASLGLMAIGLTATAGAVATTILTTRAPGMTMRRVPPFTWSALVYALGLILVMPVLFGTIVYLFLDHRNGRTGFGGNAGVVEWIGWVVTQPATLLFAIPAIGLFAELVPVVTGNRTAVRGVLFGALALVGTAAFAGVTQQSIQNLPWSGSGLNTDDLGNKFDDLVPYLLFNALPIVGLLLVLLVSLQTARPGPGSKLNPTPAFLFAFFGLGLVTVGALGNLLYAADDVGLQGTVFEEGTLLLVVYGTVLGVMGALVHWSPKLWGPAISSAKAVPLALLGAAATALAAFPLYIAGFLDQPAGTFYPDDDLAVWNIISVVGSALMLLTIVGFVGLLVTASRTDDDDTFDADPWHAQTVEWMTTSPAPRDNFVDLPVLHSAEPLLDARAAASNDGSDA
jgi:heme/copper-type cytochrome/quinol oxidase subunit 1